MNLADRLEAWWNGVADALLRRIAAQWERWKRSNGRYYGD